MNGQQARGISASSRISTILLQVCAAPDCDHFPTFASPNESEWSDLVGRAISKRVTFVLDRAIAKSQTFSGQSIVLPKTCRDAIEEQRRRIKMSSFGHMIALIEAVQFLKSHGIEPIALKGVRLAFKDYPDLQLRALRDLDLLVPAEQAERAQSAMIAGDQYAVAP